jgi:hypothetical protein
VIRSRTPTVANAAWMRLRHRVRSAVSVARVRGRCRAASTSQGGTWTTCHTCRSPSVHRTSMVTSLRASSRSVFARRARRDTSMLAESTTTLVTPSVSSHRWGQNASRPAS